MVEVRQNKELHRNTKQLLEGLLAEFLRSSVYVDFENAVRSETSDGSCFDLSLL